MHTKIILQRQRNKLYTLLQYPLQPGQHNDWPRLWQIETIHFDSTETPQTPKQGTLYTDKAYNGHAGFLTFHYNHPLSNQYNEGENWHRCPGKHYSSKDIQKDISLDGKQPDQADKTCHDTHKENFDQPWWVPLAVHQSVNQTRTTYNQTQTISNLLLFLKILQAPNFPLLCTHNQSKPKETYHLQDH